MDRLSQIAIKDVSYKQFPNINTRRHTEIIRVLPTVAHLQVMILHDQVYEPVGEIFALLIAQSVDSLHMSANSEDTLPSCNRIGADYWVLSTQIFSDILRGTARALKNLEAVIFCELIELRLREGCIQPFQEFLVRR